VTATVAGVSWGVATDRGSRRQVNEDSFLARLPVFVVADGMGGHESGEVASAYTIEALRGLLDEPTLTPDVVRAHLRRAVARIRSIPTRSGPPPGTTLTGALVVRGPDGPSWLVVNVGDSRTYRLSGGELTQVSTDHSEVAEMVARGLLTVEEAARHPHRHVVTRVLGGGGADEPEPDFFPLPFGRDPAHAPGPAGCRRPPRRGGARRGRSRQRDGHRRGRARGLTAGRVARRVRMVVVSRGRRRSPPYTGVSTSVPGSPG
jgi:serine/threonine protein phosphatase PrpC